MDSEGKLTIQISECDCKTCSKMCQAPCSGTPDDMKKLMDAGYGERLMYFDGYENPNGISVVRPALKGHEGKRAPWAVLTKAGCTFWKDGKCELHERGLKPTQGKLAHHSHTHKEHQEIRDFIKERWRDEKKVNKVIKQWKKLNSYQY